MIQAVILAGGAGTRLRPLTDTIPKPMIPVNGRPFLQYIVEWLVKYGVRECVFSIGYLADKFEEYFGDGSRFGLNIIYSVENQFLGTAGAIKLAENHLQDDFFVINGDTFLPVDLDDVYEAYRKTGRTGMIVVYDNSEKVAEGNIDIDEDGKVLAYGKKELLKKGDQIVNLGSASRNYKYVDAGVYVFKKDFLKLVKKDEFFSLEGQVYPELIDQGELWAYKTSIRHFDLGTPERLEQIRKAFK
jgi:NDP-sugar pyrophosphorylase family protein